MNTRLLDPHVTKIHRLEVALGTPGASTKIENAAEGVGWLNESDFIGVAGRLSGVVIDEDCPVK